VQNEFSVLRDVNFFNTALTSVIPKCVEEAYQREMERFQRTYGSEEEWAAERDCARKGIAAIIGARTRDIALVSNTVEGISIMARDYPWDPDRSIVVYEGEHPSNLLPWIIASRKGRFKLNLISAAGRSLTTRDVLRALDSNTQALALSMVQFSDGARPDIAAIGNECRRKGILFVVDGIQAVGRLHLDVETMNIDYMAAGGHKGLLVRNGIGFVYCARHVLEHLFPSTASCLSLQSDVPGCAQLRHYELDWHQDARRLENGNRCHQGVCALVASTGLLRELGTEQIEAQIIRLQDALMQELGEYADLLLPESSLPSGIVRLDFPDDQRDKVESVLRHKRIYATIRRNNVRFSLNFFNTVEQVHVLAEAIREIARWAGS
jgi:cysteine desulfurase/selenocysteine lyase